MAWINCSIPRTSDVDNALYVKKLELEVDFWKKQTRLMERELENIPQALEEYGEWRVTVWDKTTRVILDPKHHSEPTQ